MNDVGEISQLLKLNNELKKISNNVYFRYHDAYLMEYYANINASRQALSELNDNYEKEELEYFNRIIAIYIINGYKGMMTSLSNNSPINFLKFIMLEASKEIRGGIPTIIQEFTPLIDKVNNNLDNNINDLLLGKTIPSQVLNMMVQIMKGERNTVNLYKDIEELYLQVNEKAKIKQMNQ
jgi:hypothetical protein